jgi:hypothetical protein
MRLMYFVPNWVPQILGKMPYSHIYTVLYCSSTEIFIEYGGKSMSDINSAGSVTPLNLAKREVNFRFSKPQYNKTSVLLSKLITVNCNEVFLCLFVH